MAMKIIYNLGSRNATGYADLPKCSKCSTSISKGSIGSHYKEIDGKKYCNNCADLT